MILLQKIANSANDLQPKRV